MIVPAVLATLAQMPPAPAAEPPQGVAIMCDPVRFRFSIRADATAADPDRSYPKATFVATDDLFFDALPGWNGGREIRAPLVRYVRCGPWTFRLTGDAYNVNVQGEAGAYAPFASVTVLRGAGLWYPRDGALRLTACDRLLPRAAPCPDGYAVRLDGAYDTRGKTVHLIETASSYENDEIDKDREMRRTRRFDVADDLETWRPDPGD